MEAGGAAAKRVGELLSVHVIRVPTTMWKPSCPSCKEGRACLKAYPPAVPELLKILAEMGHGDELVIGDANFPAQSMGQRCVRADGHGGVELLDAILSLMPLDTFVDAPVTLMQVAPGTVECDPPIWKEFQATVEKHQPGARAGWTERFAFYDRARKAYACVATGERALYACVILKKGVL